ncbi:hypothetical protein [Enterobacter phage vB-EclM_KMB17]|nr:hypothetical protein [Enterobacter phage vB-EclM_KMB17]ULA52684.1 hypothetical protein [Enterobacter phage vB-EclM_KMB20]
MIITKEVEIKPRNHKNFWSEILGYEVGYHDTIMIPISKMPKKSMKLVLCSCDKCSQQFERNLQQVIDQDEHLCKKCSSKLVAKKNSIVQSGKERPWQLGEKHPRWKGNKDEYAIYSGKVHWLTKKLKPIYSQWENFDKIGLCGVEGAYQLDHKLSIKYGFYNKIPPEIIASVANLEIITWEENRRKAGTNSIDLWDLLS